MAKSKSSNQWLDEHFNDPFVKKAKQDGVRSRAYYKLEEMDKKDKLIHSGMLVVDLGAAPGGWSEYAVKRVGHKGKVIGLDILDMQPISGVDFIQGDFTEDAVLQQLLTVVAERKIDLVISDMAPNISGSAVIDQPRSMYLAELAIDFAHQVLKPGGDFLVKVFQGDGFDAYLKGLRQSFKVVKTRKPQASRGRSREQYLLAQGFLSC